MTTARIVGDEDSAQYVDGIIELMISLFGYTREQAIEKIDVMTGRTAEPIRGFDHLLYHETCEYWAKAAHYGRRDWWRSHP